MIIELKNEKLTCLVNSKGAEIISVKHKDIEFMHIANDEWNRTSPNLFPFVGCLTEGKYTYKDKEYPNLRHGFLRDLEFMVSEVTSTKAVLITKSNAESLKLYPFDYQLTITHELIDNEITTSFKVENLGEEMYFGLGTHPGFNTTNYGTTLSDYVITFLCNEDAYQLNTVNGLVTGEKGYHLASNELALSKDLFTVDSLLFDNIKSKQVKLSSSKHSLAVELFFDMPYLCIWSATNVDSFICIEPWVSMVGRKDASIRIEDRSDMIYLKENESFETSLKLRYTYEN